MKLDILDNKGKAVEQIELSDTIFGIKPNQTVLQQYVRVFRGNQRQGTASSKTRAEVSGSGAKPWRQKGTGRARVGEKRNPVWRGGGISHGPKPKDWTRKLNKKVRQLALASALSLKASGKDLGVFKDFNMKKANTKDLKNILEIGNMLGRRTLLVLDTNDMNVRNSASNLPGVETALVSNVNAYEVLLANKVVFSKDSISMLQDRFGVSAKKTSTKKSTSKKEDK